VQCKNYVSAGTNETSRICAGSPQRGSVAAEPRALRPGPRLAPAKARDSTFDCLCGFLESGGVSAVSADSHAALLELMGSPLYGTAVWRIKALLAFQEGTDTVRARLVEARRRCGRLGSGPPTSLDHGARRAAANPLAAVRRSAPLDHDAGRRGWAG
jgi:hypothetical protein